MKRFLEAPYRFALCWTALLLTAFGWALLDTFVPIGNLQRKR